MSYQGDGVTKQFSVPFPYLRADNVKVTVDDSEVTFSFLSSGIIALQTAPESGAAIKIFRRTDVSQVAVDYTDGSVLLEEDLDFEALHHIYVAQEVYDNALDAVETSNRAEANSLQAESDSSEALAKVDEFVIQGYASLNIIKGQAEEARDAAILAKDEAEGIKEDTQGIADQLAIDATGYISQAKEQADKAEDYKNEFSTLIDDNSEAIHTIQDNLGIISTSADNIGHISTVANDLEAKYLDNLDLGFINAPVEPQQTITGGVIKTVADRLEELENIVNNLTEILASSSYAQAAQEYAAASQASAEASQFASMGSIKYNVSQSLSDSEKLMAQGNIGLAGGVPETIDCGGVQDSLS